MSDECPECGGIGEIPEAIAHDHGPSICRPHTCPTCWGIPNSQEKSRRSQRRP